MPEAVRGEGGAPAPPCLGRILLVDDEVANRDMLGRRLQWAGYEVVRRGDALRIEDELASERFDLVLLDWMMPLRSGLDALLGLRTRFDMERTPVIIATAADDDNVLAEALAAGANDYVTKPVSLRVLLARAKVQLDRRAAVLELDAIRGGLEQAVSERTRELTAANGAPLAEITEREAAEERARAMALHDGRSYRSRTIRTQSAARPFRDTLEELGDG